MKAIFLDIDGVLNAADYSKAIYALKVSCGHGDIIDEFGYLFDPRCVKHLDYIIRDTGAKIVISSTWRCNGIETLRKMWEMRDLPGEIIDITPLRKNPKIEERYYHPGVDRGYEIQEWLDNHPEVEDYAILDDDDDMLPSQNLVLCDSPFGITWKEVEKVFEYLKC